MAHVRVRGKRCGPMMVAEAEKRKGLSVLEMKWLTLQKDSILGR